MTDYARLFEPLTLRGRTLPNRIVSTPHATGWEIGGGLLCTKETDYLIRKAQGGVGLVMTFGSASVDPSTAASYGSIALWDERNELELRRLADGVHTHGSLVISQATHMGHRASSRISLSPVRGVSELPEPEHGEIASPLTVDELRELPSRFADAALRLQRCGWDGIEITSFGHLIEQFWNPAFNTRTDEYGGSLENRMRLGRDIVRTVRQAVDGDFLLCFRMSLDPMSSTRDFGIPAAEMRTIAREMCATGDIDLLSTTVGDAMNRPALSIAMGSDQVPPVPGAEAAAAVSAAVDVPVLLAGRILDGERAEELLASGTVDLVGMTRAVIADPDLPRKLRSGERIRPCIGINQGCIGRLYSGFPVVCSVNPAIRDPQLDVLEVAVRPRRIVVVGGGVAGLEAARHAARRGHVVTLLERGGEVGGRALLNATHGWRPAWHQYLDYLRGALEDLGVTVRTGADASAAAILAMRPEAVVLATGSRMAEALTGPDGAAVVDADAVVAAPPAPGGNPTAVVIDDSGGMLAPTAADALARAGWRVTLATEQPMLAGKVDATMLPFVHRRLEDAELTVLPDQRLLSAPGPDLLLEHTLTGRLRTLEAPGLTVIAGHRRAHAPLRQELAAAAPELEVHVVGDALAPRDLDAATGEGALVGATL